MALGLDGTVVIALAEGEAARQRFDRTILRVERASAACACGTWLNTAASSCQRMRTTSPTFTTSAGRCGRGPMLLMPRYGRAHFILSQLTVCS